MTDLPSRVQDVMDSSRSETLNPDEVLGDVMERIVETFRLNTIPVVKDGRLLGVFRLKSLLAKHHGHRGERTNRRQVLKHLAAERVRDLMVSPPAVLRPDDTLHRAAEVMLSSTWHELPVVDDDHRLAGIVTARALARVQVMKGPPQ